MKGCDRVHEKYDCFENGEVEQGVLPTWMHVNGKVASYVFQGSYRGLSEAWAKFGKKLESMETQKFAGPPGDVYPCDPVDHQGDD